MEDINFLKVKYTLLFLIVFLLGVVVGIPVTYFLFEKRVENLASTFFTKLSNVDKMVSTDKISPELDVNRKKFVLGRVVSINSDVIKIDTSNDVNYFQYKTQGYINVLVSSSTKFNEFTPKKENKNGKIDIKSKEDNFFIIVETNKEKISIGDKISAIVEGDMIQLSINAKIINIFR